MATLGLGTMARSSPGKGASRPPLKKNVTCGYFSVSAVRSCASPASLMTSPTRCRMDCGSNATGKGNWSS